MQRDSAMDTQEQLQQSGWLPVLLEISSTLNLEYVSEYSFLKIRVQTI